MLAKWSFSLVSSFWRRSLRKWRLFWLRVFSLSDNFTFSFLPTFPPFIYLFGDYPCFGMLCTFNYSLGCYVIWLRETPFLWFRRTYIIFCFWFGEPFLSHFWISFFLLRKIKIPWLKDLVFAGAGVSYFYRACFLSLWLPFWDWEICTQIILINLHLFFTHSDYTPWADYKKTSPFGVSQMVVFFS